MHTPSLELDVQGRSQPLMMGLHGFSSDIPCSQMSRPSHGRNLASQNQSSWVFGPQEPITEVPLPMVSSNQSSGTLSHMSCGTPTTGGLFEFELDSFVQPAQMGRMLGSSSNMGYGGISSLDGSWGPANDNVVVLQQQRKKGQRLGPLTAPARRKANVMRKVRSCVACRLAKTSVSWARYAPCENLFLTLTLVFSWPSLFPVRK
jgi:hypothetical protein